jgi:hypothetical protein
MAEATQESNSIDWTASEFIDHQRGSGWYLLLLGCTVALAAFVYLISKDYVATVIIVALGFVTGSIGHLKPKQAQYLLTDKGFHVDDQFYAYNQFKFFSIVHEGELSSLVFARTKRYLPPLTAFIDKEAEDAITELVGEHLPMQNTTLDGIDRLSRRLRL